MTLPTFPARNHGFPLDHPHLLSLHLQLCQCPGRVRQRLYRELREPPQGSRAQSLQDGDVAPAVARWLGFSSKKQVKSAKETGDLDGFRMISDDLGVLRFFKSEHVRIGFVQAKNCSNMYARIGLNMKKHTGSNDRAFNQEHMSFSKKEIVK